MKIKSIFEKNYTYVESKSFNTKNIEKKLFSSKLKPLPCTRWYAPTLDIDIPSNLPVLSIEEERTAFLQYNFSKKKICEIKEKYKKISNLTRAAKKHIIKWNAIQEHLHEYIMRINLPLVLAMSKRNSLVKKYDYHGMISEGNLALLRSIEFFDIDKGFKFSTYACRSIIQAFSSLAIKRKIECKYIKYIEQDSFKEPSIEVNLEDTSPNAFRLQEIKKMINENMPHLSKLETDVIYKKYQFINFEKNKKPTNEEISAELGISRIQVGYIHSKALSKLRNHLVKNCLK